MHDAKGLLLKLFKCAAEKCKIILFLLYETNRTVQHNDYKLVFIPINGEQKTENLPFSVCVLRSYSQVKGASSNSCNTNSFFFWFNFLINLLMLLNNA